MPDANISKTQFWCDQCNKVYKTKSSLTTHSKIKHQTKQPTAEERPKPPGIVFLFEDIDIPDMDDYYELEEVNNGNQRVEEGASKE